MGYSPLATSPRLAPAPQVVARLVGKVADERFADLGQCQRVWAIGAINGDNARIAAVHDALFTVFRPGDRIVYLGNYLGAAEPTLRALDEVIAFRRVVLAIPGVKVEDIAYLRGINEELWQKLLQLQFCPNPAEVLDWMEPMGIGQILNAYGSSMQEARLYLRDRPLGVTKWTNQLRAARRAASAHEAFSSVLKRAAFTRENSGAPGPLLFVHAGIDARLPMSQQNDQFWWGHRGFDKLSADGFAPFRRIVRGYHPASPRVISQGAALTLDAGAGRGGVLLLTAFGPQGEILDQQAF